MKSASVAVVDYRCWLDHTKAAQAGDVLDPTAPAGQPIALGDPRSE